VSLSLWNATGAALIALHLGAKQLADDDGSRFGLSGGLPINPGDDVLGKANWDRDAHRREDSAL